MSDDVGYVKRGSVVLLWNDNTTSDDIELFLKYQDERLTTVVLCPQCSKHRAKIVREMWDSGVDPNYLFMMSNDERDTHHFTHEWMDIINTAIGEIKHVINE